MCVCSQHRTRPTTIRIHLGTVEMRERLSLCVCVLLIQNYPRYWRTVVVVDYITCATKIDGNAYVLTRIHAASYAHTQILLNRGPVYFFRSVRCTHNDFDLIQRVYVCVFYSYLVCARLTYERIFR